MSKTINHNELIDGLHRAKSLLLELGGAANKLGDQKTHLRVNNAIYQLDKATL